MIMSILKYFLPSCCGWYATRMSSLDIAWIEQSGLGSVMSARNGPNFISPQFRHIFIPSYAYALVSFGSWIRLFLNLYIHIYTCVCVCVFFFICFFYYTMYIHSSSAPRSNIFLQLSIVFARASISIHAHHLPQHHTRRSSATSTN